MADGIADQADRLATRRAAIARAWVDHGGPVVIPSGLPLPVAGTDQFHDFHAHAEHYYLSGTSLPGSVLTFDAREGWRLFAAQPDIEERVWVGDGISLEETAARAGLERVSPATALQGWLEAHRGEAVALLGNGDLTHHSEGYALSGWASLEFEVDREASARLSEQVAEARRAKDAGELALMRAASRATARGHLSALRHTRPGMTERDLQIEVEAEFFRGGGQRTAYSSLVGSGPNSSILHFSPTGREFAEGELVLMDAAAECDGYAADVTRTFPVGPRFSGAQRDIYQLVLETQEAAVAAARPGVEFKDLHLAASARIAEGLAGLGILRGSAQSLVERDAHAIFFPHGLGHMLGLATHDAGGCLAGREKSDRFGLKWLRADLPLREDYVVTIEPGIYFIRALLTNPEWRTRYRDEVDWERVDTMIDFGGVRIEDDVRITSGGGEVLSAAVPKSMAAIEALRQEARA